MTECEVSDDQINHQEVEETAHNKGGVVDKDQHNLYSQYESPRVRWWGRGLFNTASNTEQVIHYI